MRVGTRIMKALTIADSLGVCTSGEIAADWLEEEPANVGKYCRRAVSMRLMTIDRTVSPHQFAVVPGWREMARPMKGIVRKKQPPKPKPDPCLYVPKPFALQGVWQ